MTRGERQCARERLLTAGSSDKEGKVVPVVVCLAATTEIATGDDADSDCSEGPLCSICLGEYMVRRLDPIENGALEWRWMIHFTHANVACDLFSCG
jgi:hypothetical protein